jgi:hypothetical protein
MLACADILTQKPSLCCRMRRLYFFIAPYTLKQVFFSSVKKNNTFDLI